MNLKHFITGVFMLLILFGLSCTPYKNVPYFQDLRRDTVTSEPIVNFTPSTIQAGDQLGVHVISQSKEADAIFNPATEVNSVNALTSPMLNYIVDSEGSIHMPLIGAVKASGQSTLALSKHLETQLSTYLKNPVVKVTVQNFKVSVFGDVKTPGSFNVPNERMTIPEVISLAGDLNVTGLRVIMLIRETNGKREYIPIDLRSKKLFTSPYYYLQKNDVIYVQPNKARAANDGTTFQQASLIISVLSIIALLIAR
ncbi:polysaccharide biosynthesis/export family protein [Hufsiella ginkgonis]|uniref:Polysaccharide export protein n=1 Tax=Hufsiella ginkgonis TaxID=2695274 RepID=A0A7K1Y2C6_9SPHI|nr:polysaccharide biosynthesis/export family protein [Hufsiella ginkgonis]MXV17434.1 polysaccharide export protein [Hufsiella ginkgonis]